MNLQNIFLTSVLFNHVITKSKMLKRTIKESRGNGLRPMEYGKPMSLINLATNWVALNESKLKLRSLKALN